MKWICILFTCVLISPIGIFSAEIGDGNATLGTEANQKDETTEQTTWIDPTHSFDGSTTTNDETADLEITTTTEEVSTRLTDEILPVTTSEPDVVPTVTNGALDGFETTTDGLSQDSEVASTLPEEVDTTTADTSETTTEGSWFGWILGGNEEETDDTGATTTTTSATTSDVSETLETTSFPTELPIVTDVTDSAVSSDSITTTTENIVTNESVPTTTPSSQPVTPSTLDLEKTKVVAFKLSDQIRAILQHYKDPNPIGFPGAPIPDPLLIPSMNKSFSLAKMDFNQVKVKGLSKFRVEHVNTDLEKMQVYVQLHIKMLEIVGNYTLKSWFKKAAGPFTVNLYDVIAEGAAALQPDDQGHLEASDSNMDMHFKNIKMDFKNMGFAGSIFEGMVSSVGTFLFDGIKPYILDEVNTNMRRDVNAKIKTLTSKLPGYVSPIDLAVSEGRKYVKRMGYDPYHLRNYEFQRSLIKINITDLWLSGLSRFYRVNDISLSIDNNTLQIGIQLATKQVTGRCLWMVSFGNHEKLARTGESNFTVDHIQIRAFVNQSLNIRHHPILDDLDIEVGKIRLNMDGRGSLDYIIEIVVNHLPDLIRHIIVDVLEEPIRAKVQTIFDQVNLEEIIESKLPELDNLQ